MRDIVADISCRDEWARHPTLRQTRTRLRAAIRFSDVSLSPLGRFPRSVTPESAPTAEAERARRSDFGFTEMFHEACEEKFY
jgi:hypothetical protein